MGNSNTIALGFKLTGESEFKRGLSDINNNLKVNASEMALVSAKYQDNNKSSAALSAQNKILQTTLENQKAKLAELQKAIASTSTAHINIGKSIESLKTKLTSETAKMNEMKSSTTVTAKEIKAQRLVIQTLEKELKKTGTAYTATGKSTTNYSTQLNKTKAQIINTNKQLKNNQKALKNTKKSTSSLGGALSGMASSLGVNVSPALQGVISKLDGVSKSGAGLVLVITGITTALAKMTIDAANTADDINTLSKVTGMTTDQIQEYNYSAKLVDVSTETISGSLKKMIRSMDMARTSTSEQAKAFEKLRVRTKNSSGQLKDSNDVFLKTIDALGKVKNETDRDALSMAIFGKSATELNPLIEAGSGKMREYAEEAHRVGAVLGSETLDKFNELRDAMDRLNEKTMALKLSFAEALLPVLTALSEVLSSIPTPVLKMIISFAGIIAMIVLTIKAVKEVKGAWSGVSKVFSRTNKIADTTIYKILLVVAAIGILITALAVLFGKGEQMESSVKAIGDSVGKIRGQANSRQQPVSRTVPRYARGTSYHQGGRALVGEEGPEIIDLPRGSRVYPHGVNPSGGDIYNITIPAREVQEFNDIIRVAQNVKQQRRAK